MASFKYLGLEKYFEQPPLVSGPEIMFYVPCSQHIPFAMQRLNEAGDVIGYGLPVTSTVITTWIVMAVLAILFKWGTSNLQKVPAKKQAFFETLYKFFNSLAEGNFGLWSKKYLVYITSLFLFLVVSNTITFIPVPKIAKVFENGHYIWKISPLMRAPTADINTTVGLALITTIQFLFAAFRTQGILGYLKGLTQPVFVMLPMNIIGEMAKPVNISMRLFGNMFAGMVIMGLLYMAMPMLVPAPLHLYFDLFQGLVQAYVFTMLTMVYIKSSLGDAVPETE